MSKEWIGLPHESPTALGAFYGDPERLYYSKLVEVRIPWPCVLSWDHSKTIQRTRMHEKCAKKFQKLWDTVADSYTWDEIKELGLDVFGGAYNKRRIRRGSTWSLHAYGAAWDVDPVRNGLDMGKDEANLGTHYQAGEFWDIVKKCGLYGLGPNIGRDFMHIQAAYRT